MTEDRELHRLLFPKGCLLKDCPYEQPTPDEWVAACISACYATVALQGAARPECKA